MNILHGRESIYQNKKSEVFFLACYIYWYWDYSVIGET